MQNLAFDATKQERCTMVSATHLVRAFIIKTIGLQPSIYKPCKESMHI